METAVRVFFCKTCRSRGSLEELTHGLYVVSCGACDVSEIWGMETLFDPLNSFDYLDRPLQVAEA